MARFRRTTDAKLMNKSSRQKQHDEYAEIDVEWMSNICETKKTSEIRKKISAETKEKSPNKLSLKTNEKMLPEKMPYFEMSKENQKTPRFNAANILDRFNALKSNRIQQRNELRRAIIQVLPKKSNLKNDSGERSATTSQVVVTPQTSTFKATQMPNFELCQQLSFKSIGTFGRDIVGPRSKTVLQLNAALQTPKTFDQLLRNSLFKISVDTMAITALPLDCWLKERLKNWVQLSGHEGTIVPASNHTLWKKQPNGNVIEAQAYTEIMKDSSLEGLTPKFFKEIVHKNESFIEIEDLLSGFPKTTSRLIMDIKIGIRTFLESEVSNTTKRTDLYKKMIDLDPEEPTPEECLDKAITKLRYMQFREKESSTASLGFRIEAAQHPGGQLQKSFKKVQTKEQVLDTLIHFFGKDSSRIRTQLSKRLKSIRKGVENSEFFQNHEVVGSSILIISDDKKTGAWMIDFAKSMRLPEGTPPLNHRMPWKIGNHEDGYLFGLDNLIQIIDI